MTAVMFPDTSIIRPDLLQHPSPILLSTVPQTLQQAMADIQVAVAQPQQVRFYAGHLKTPVFFWFAAQQQSPQAQLWCQQECGSWVELHSQQVLEPGLTVDVDLSPQVAPVPTIARSIPSNSQALPQSSPQEQSEPLPEAFDQILENIFRLHAWGKEEAARTLLEAKEHFANNPTAVAEFEKGARQGVHAANLVQTLQKKWQSGEGEIAIQAWLKNLQKQPYRIKKHLKIVLNKLVKYKNNQHTKLAARQDFRITLPQYSLNGQTHRQSFRALLPATQWQILIDETGDTFDQTALALDQTDQHLGKIIALALPDNTNLPPLEKPIHATDLPHLHIQQLLADILQSNSGVFGATVHDLTTYSWIGAIAKLTRWALLMLPVSGPTRVKILIEQRHPFVETQQLNAFCATLENELKLLAPERFAQLHLTIEIMKKNHPYNGYVDVIANAWGSPDRIKRQLLARTLWRGHCLLDKLNLENIEQFYQRISYQEHLTPADWFLLCTLAAAEPEHSFILHLSKLQQQKTIQNPKLWQEYLREVQYRIARKNYTAAGLRLALSWLDNARSDQQLPAPLLLQQLSLQQAADNHVGLCDIEKAKQILKLAKQLRDEIPFDACEASLRVAISATHLMDFNSATTYLQNWLEQPIAVAGLANYGKLHSTLGQLAAFRRDYATAQTHFASALAAFGKLSDQRQAQKELQQTQTYQAIAWLDQDNNQATQAITSLLNLGAELQQSTEFSNIARSGHSERFRQYLLLRWLICQPQHTDIRCRYLALIKDWQMGEGHPWMLIQAYRAWLLADDAQLELANQYMQQAIDECLNGESMLLCWMGHVLSALAQSIGLDCTIENAPTWPGYLPSAQLSTLAAASTHPQRLDLLQQLLPFNFH